MDQLGLPKVCKELIMRPRGLFLVTGPTGSGKCTSLASMINHLNETVDHHIITIEDPIEFYHEHKKSTVNQREIGVDVPSFAEAIRRALRQDPDVILVGEMRDLETIEAAITAAETGHVVFGTLHTNGAQGTVNRIIDVFPTSQQDQIRTQLSTSIIGILSQALLPQIGGGRVAGPRNAGGHVGHRQPDPREQDVPHHLGDSDRRQIRHAALGRLTVQPVAAKGSSTRKKCWSSPITRRTGRHCQGGRGLRDEAEPTRHVADEDDDISKQHPSGQSASEVRPDANRRRFSLPYGNADASARSSSIWASSATNSSRMLLEEQQQRPGRAARASGRGAWGWSRDDQLAQALAEQMNMQVIRLTRHGHSARGAGLRHRADGPAVPDHSGQLSRTIRSSIAMCDPQKLSIQDELRNFLGYDIRAVVATERDIKAALERYYSPRPKASNR